MFGKPYQAEFWGILRCSFPVNLNPYLPWNVSPTGALIGLLALLAMFYHRKKGKRGIAEPYLLLLCV
jgi:hypothetical protein